MTATATKFLATMRDIGGSHVGAAAAAAACKLALNGWAGDDAGGWTLADGCSVTWNTRREDRWEEVDILLGKPANGLGLDPLALTIEAMPGKWHLDRWEWERIEAALERMLEADEDRRVSALQRFAEKFGEGRWVRKGQWVEVSEDGDITYGGSGPCQVVSGLISTWPEVNRALARAQFIKRLAEVV
ncbi:MAG: hypothetical protein Q4D89_03860 [Arachnia propionica]|uniref:hypothetical protein n=1 Tax=Arachnia propionica TaxID=1750 RepID=UPI00270C5F64|nr:hypothetical protein [Arachnia propionica]